MAEVPGRAASAASTAPGGGESTRVRLDHQVRREESVLARMGEAMSEARPEVLYRGDDVEQWFTPPTRDPRGSEATAEPR